MALVKSRGKKLFLTTCDSASSTTSFTEYLGDQLEIPTTEWKTINTAGRQGASEFGDSTYTTAIMSTFNLKGYRIGEFATIIARAMAKGYTPVGTGPYTHPLHSVLPSDITIPVFAMEHGDGTTNDRYTNCLINNFTIEVNNEDSTEASITAEGFCNRFSDASSLNSTGSISSAAINFGGHPLLNLKLAKAWIGESPSSGSMPAASVNFGTSNLINPVEITSIINSFTLQYSNGLDANKLSRAGSQVLNAQIRGDRTGSLEMQVQEDNAVYDFLSNMVQSGVNKNIPTAFEAQFYGPEISGGLDYTFNIICNKMALHTNEEIILETPKVLNLSFNLHDKDNAPLQFFSQDTTSTAYNA